MLLCTRSLFLTILATTAWAQTDTITQVVDDNSDFDTLAEALDETDLDVTLSGTGPYTVFAPNDAAWRQLRTMAPRFYDRLFTEPWNLHLSTILQTHIVSGSNIASSSITDGQIIMVVTGQNLTASVSSETVRIAPAVESERAEVETADIAASNGVIHEIDDIIKPTFLGFTISELTDDRDYAFYDLVEAAGLDNFFDRRLGLTVFVPNDDAIDELDDDVVDFLLTPRGRPYLRKILLYHVINVVVPSSQIDAGVNRARTFQGEFITVENEGDGEIDVNDYNVVQADILASNGIIHLIDAVLIPPSLQAQMADASDSYTVVPAKGKGYYTAPAKGKGYVAPAKGKGYLAPPKGKGYIPPVLAKGKGYGAPAKGKGYVMYYSPPAKGYYRPPSMGFYSKGKGSSGYYAKGKGYYSGASSYAKGKGYYPAPSMGYYAKGKGYYGGMMMGMGMGYYW